MSDYRLSNTAPVFSAGTGTISCTAGTVNVTGVGTLFSTELEVGDILKVGAIYLSVLTITDDTHLTLQVAPVSNISGAAFTYTTLPLVDGFSTPVEPIFVHVHVVEGRPSPRAKPSPVSRTSCQRTGSLTNTSAGVLKPSPTIRI